MHANAESGLEEINQLSPNKFSTLAFSLDGVLRIKGCVILSLRA